MSKRPRTRRLRMRRALPAAILGTSGVASLVALIGTGASGWGSVFRANEDTSAIAAAPFSPSPFIQEILRGPQPFNITAQEVHKAPTATLGEHTLTFNSADENEETNVDLCVRALDGLVIPAGAEFSFNDVVGERTEERGFRAGLMYVSGTVISDIGGGVCIPSTALYNAALNAGLEIVERYNHSGPVHYAEPGLDAAVVFGQKDFRFRNNTKGPITIHMNALGDNLAVSLEGAPQPGRRVVVERVGYGEIPFAEQKTLDATIPQGQPQVKQEGRHGYVVTVIRTFFQGRKFVKRETVSHDNVAPRPRIVVMNPLDDPTSPEAIAKAKVDAETKAKEEAASGATPESAAPAEPAATTTTSEPKADTKSEVKAKPKKAIEVEKPVTVVRPAEPGSHSGPKVIDITPAKPEPKAELKAEPKTEPKVESKAEPKAAPKPAPKPEARPEAKPDTKAAPKPDVKPEPKVEAKPEPKIEPKVESAPVNRARPF